MPSANSRKSLDSKELGNYGCPVLVSDLPIFGRVIHIVVLSDLARKVAIVVLVGKETGSGLLRSSVFYRTGST
jgi:hypothetical protein